MRLKKLLALAAIGLLLFLIISAPGEAADMGRGLLSGLSTAASAIINFVQGVFA